MSKILFHRGVKQEKIIIFKKGEIIWLTRLKQLQIHINRRSDKFHQSDKCGENWVSWSHSFQITTKHHLLKFLKFWNLSVTCLWLFKSNCRTQVIQARHQGTTLPQYINYRAYVTGNPGSFSTVSLCSKGG